MPIQQLPPGLNPKDFDTEQGRQTVLNWILSANSALWEVSKFIPKLIKRIEKLENK